MAQATLVITVSEPANQLPTPAPIAAQDTGGPPLVLLPWRPHCGLGFERVFLPPPLMWLQRQHGARQHYPTTTLRRTVV